jgi:divalent metal cation (Fe/Co/Zn/Cd) transporter
LLLYVSARILSITRLLGEVPDQDLIDKISADIKVVYGNDLELHHFHLHNYISQRELTLHIRLNKNMSIEEGHEIATTIEEIIKRQFGIIATIHIEPMR